MWNKGYQIGKENKIALFWEICFFTRHYYYFWEDTRHYFRKKLVLFEAHHWSSRCDQCDLFFVLFCFTMLYNKWSFLSSYLKQLNRVCTPFYTSWPHGFSMNTLNKRGPHRIASASKYSIRKMYGNNLKSLLHW